MPNEAIAVGAAVTFAGTAFTEILTQKQTKLHEALIVSITGALLTAATIFLADEVVKVKNKHRTNLAIAIGAGVSALATFVTGYFAESIGVNVYTRAFLVGLAGASAYIFVRMV